MRVLVTDYAWADLTVEKRVLDEIGVELVAAPDGSEETLARLAAGVNGIMTCWAMTTSHVIQAALPDLKVVTRYGVGLDNIDVAYATAHGIPVAYVPDYCMVDVAEHAMALLLALSRKVAGFDRSVRGGTWGYPGLCAAESPDRTDAGADRLRAHCAGGRGARVCFRSAPDGDRPVDDSRVRGGGGRRGRDAG